MKLVKLPDTELEIMKVIWKEGSPISTSQIKAVLDEMRPWNVSALQTLLNRLIDRNFLKTFKDGKNKCYESLVEEADYIAFENKSFLERMNHSSITKLVASLYESRNITDEDLEELAQFIEKNTGGTDD
ncbi:CopY family transcriptional regulator [Clostridium sp. chh4-2]|uniref:BlaI/MecI/CopY family transcriptional regulator n=1 Tax=Clostridium sp. chh4-2 TaxID=2067550 RepID=UPI000CCEBBC8|nr:BlaI/MecI/CopY family transcriptional regulator [Clostridium sp. chh4-2]PNV62732.1 CopY family transcriptional regulator [Clostridium sp. chh4-2]